MKKRVLTVLVAVVLIASVAMPMTMLAAQPVPVYAVAQVAVTQLNPSDIVPAGASGRVRILAEQLQGQIVYGPAELYGAGLFLQQKSNELFSSAILPLAVALDGTAIGDFQMVGGSGEIAHGTYHLSVSNAPGCQVYDQGHWSTTGGSQLKGRGTVTACLNWDPYFGTFVGTVQFTGSLN